jgi:hypothetical protein
LGAGAHTNLGKNLAEVKLVVAMLECGNKELQA